MIIYIDQVLLGSREIFNSVGSKPKIYILQSNFRKLKLLKRLLRMVLSTLLGTTPKKQLPLKGRLSGLATKWVQCQAYSKFLKLIVNISTDICIIFGRGDEHDILYN